MVDTKAADGYEPNNYDDPSANLWSTYLSKSEKYDRTMAENWKGDMDAILIFAGLFSASVTAFIVESYRTLSPDSGDETVLLLVQISHQLSALSTGTVYGPVSLTTPLVPNQMVFKPPLSSLVCNTLWFLSLGASLVCAVAATLVEQWTRQFLQASNSRPAPQDRARMNAYLYQSVKRYKMATIVETIPMLLHLSLFLFFGGLIAFLVPINTSLAYLASAILFFCCGFYFLVTILPIMDLSCPYWTPLSSVFWSILLELKVLYRRDADGNRVLILSHMSKAREADAIDVTSERDRRDMKAMCWTISALREDNEFEPFVEVIPNVVSGIDYSAKWLLDALMMHEDINVRLGHRIPRLLASCTSGLLDPSIAHKRAITCLKSIWSLTMLSIPQSHHLNNHNRQFGVFRDNLRFKEDTFDLFYNVQKAVPSVETYLLSASVVVARSLLDMQVERANIMEEKLVEFEHTHQHGFTPTIQNFHYNAAKDAIIAASKQRLESLSKYVYQPKHLKTPLPHVLTEAAAIQLSRLVSSATATPNTLDDQFNKQVVELIKTFQIMLNQAGLNLALLYVAEMLRSDSLPHEAFNTIRRTFFRMRFDLPLSVESQEMLVHYLGEATEQTASWSTRLPQSIIDIVLGLTRVLTEPNLIMKATKIVEEYTKTTSNDAARSTLLKLQKMLPLSGLFVPQTTPILDLFSSHVYADAKPLRK